MGDLFKSDNEQQTAQKGYTRSVFEDPNSKKLIDQLSGQFSNPYQTDDASKNVQNAGIQSMLAGLGKGAQTVDTTGALNAIRAASDAQTPKDIASVRSQMYNKPQGRNEIAVADTVSRNNATRDAALYNTEMAGQQFNAQQQNSATQNQNQLAQVLSQYMNPSQTGQANNNAQALQLLSLLRGEDTLGANLSSGSQTAAIGPTILQALGGAAGGAAMAAMCWVAREVFGTESGEWLLFREWMVLYAPEWFVKLYLAKGEKFAAYIKDKPKLKALIRFWMKGKVNKVVRLKKRYGQIIRN
jgi:hypothetical protein